MVMVIGISSDSLNDHSRRERHSTNDVFWSIFCLISPLLLGAIDHYHAKLLSIEVSNAWALN